MPSRLGRVEQVLEQPELVDATDERRLERLAPADAAALGDDPDGPPGGDRARLALEDLLASLLERDRPLAPPGRSPPPPGPCRGRRPIWSRLAVLTMSPATIPWSVAPSVTAASPVSTPTRTSIPGPSDADRVDEVERGPDRPLGVVLVSDRGAPHRHHGVADELLDRAAVAADDLADSLEVAVLQLADLLGVAALGERGEPDEIGEQDGDEPALGDGVVGWVPASAAS